MNKQFSMNRLVRFWIPALALALTLPGQVQAQGAVSKEESARRQQGLLDAIAKMEAVEARQRAAAEALQAAQTKNAQPLAARQRALEAAPELAVDSAAIARAKTAAAARDSQVRREASSELLAQLDPPRDPGGAVPVQGNGPAPGPKPIPLAERQGSGKKRGDEAKQETEIVAKGGSTFNSKANLVVFDGDVKVNDPRFDLICDRLIVFLKAQAEEDESPLDRAIATGKKVVVRKVGEDGEVQIGQARKVTFDGKTGNVILEDWPQVQSGFKLIQAQAQETIITLNEDGKMTVDGPSYTKIVQPAAAKTSPETP